MGVSLRILFLCVYTYTIGCRFDLTNHLYEHTVVRPGGANGRHKQQPQPPNGQSIEMGRVSPSHQPRPPAPPQRKQRITYASQQQQQQQQQQRGGGGAALPPPSRGVSLGEEEDNGEGEEEISLSGPPRRGGLTRIDLS